MALPHNHRPTYDPQTALATIERARREARANPSQRRGRRDTAWLLRVTDPQEPLNMLHISSAAYATPPLAYGGLENVVNDLCAEQRGLGHKVRVFAPATSAIEGLIPTIERPVLDLDNEMGWTHHGPFALHHVLISRWMRQQDKMGKLQDSDTVIGHLGSLYDPPSCEILAQANDAGVIPLVLKHSPLNLDRRWSPERGEELLGHTDATYADKYWRHLPLVALGEQDRANALAMFPQAWMVHAITSGLAEGSFVPLRRQRLNAVGTLGRITPDKGQADAIRLAKRAGQHIIVAGNIDNRAYFNNEVRPQIDVDLSEQPEQVSALLSGADTSLLDQDTPICIFVGSIGGKEKLDFFSGIRVFLLPLRWEEPQGIVLLEAWAAGTPVVAYSRGSVPALMAPHRGQWGFDPRPGDETGFIEAIRASLSLDSALIAQWAREQFHMRAAAQKYVDLQRYLCALWWLYGGDWFAINR